MLKMVDRIADFGVRQIDITGGEPFVRKDVFKIIERAHQRNLWINITTNATLLDDQDIERLFQFGVRSLQISIDGAKSETHDKIRGKDG
ncbi:MAG: radical SAM protein, partial [Candidatus Aenigmatarchaeota archaeon]